MELMTKFPSDKDIQRVRYDTKKAKEPCQKAYLALVDCIAKAKQRDRKLYDEWKADDVKWMKHVSTSCSQAISSVGECQVRQTAKELESLRRSTAN